MAEDNMAWPTLSHKKHSFTSACVCVCMVIMVSPGIFKMRWTKPEQPGQRHMMNRLNLEMQ